MMTCDKTDKMLDLSYVTNKQSNLMYGSTGRDTSDEAEIAHAFFGQIADRFYIPTMKERMVVWVMAVVVSFLSMSLL